MPTAPPDEAVSSQTGNTSKRPSRDVVDVVLKRIGETRHSEAGGAYMIFPEKRFISMQDDETIALLLRAHPITNVKWIILVIVMLLAPDIFVGLGMFAAVPARILFVGKLTWYLVTLGYAFEKFLYWYYSIVIVTNERVIDIDFRNLLQRDIAYAALNHIEEPSMQSGGLVRSIFHYGSVYIATAAEEPAVEAKDVPFPDRAVRIISELQEALEESRGIGGGK